MYLQNTSCKYVRKSRDSLLYLAYIYLPDRSTNLAGLVNKVRLSDLNVQKFFVVQRIYY